jgi:hypothetical protein
MRSGIWHSELCITCPVHPSMRVCQCIRQSSAVPGCTASIAVELSTVPLPMSLHYSVCSGVCALLPCGVFVCCPAVYCAAASKLQRLHPHLLLMLGPASCWKQPKTKTAAALQQQQPQPLHPQHPCGWGQQQQAQVVLAGWVVPPPPRPTAMEQRGCSSTSSSSSSSTITPRGWV